jgi:2,4-dienoyl-CoA reductase-like NADH-dependent reductase (Old Yellow Enzyme family)
MALNKVFSPLKVGGIELPNRIARTAHGVGLARFGMTEDMIAYHVARAKGGCGLNIIEAGTVHPSCHLDFAIYDDSALPGLARLADAVRPYGMKQFQQLWHGGNLYGDANGGPPLSVSTVPGFTGRVGRPMTIGEIEGIVEGFANTALRCKRAGIDGVEIHAAHGYIFHQFLSLASNTRTDRYGGEVANRLRFLLEVARAIRAAVGPDYPVGVRVGASQAPNTINESLAETMVGALCAEGLVDYVNASWGDYYKMDTMIGAMHHPLGYELASSTQLLVNANVPRLVTGRVRTLDEAESLLRDNVADIISMVRAMIADPMLVAKTRAGHPEQVRPCIACNQGCVGGLGRIGRIGCTVNATAGFEATLDPIELPVSQTPRKVVVIGGGPAGMEAARVAALTGHRVTLIEATSDLGGTINIAKRAPRLHTVGDIAWWLEAELERLGVEVRLNTYAEADAVLAEAPDVVFIATGSLPRMDGFQLADPGEPALGVDLPHVVSSNDLIGNNMVPGASALILDNVGHVETMAVIEYLLSHGTAVTLVTHQPQLLSFLETTLRIPPALERLSNGSFEALLRHHLVEIQPRQCRVRSIFGRAEKLVAADTVVLITPNEPMRELFDALRDRLPDVRLIGDAAGPRDIQAAIADGYRSALAIQ